MDSDQDMQCLKCGGMLAKKDAYCPNCGLDLKGPDAAELRDLEATERQIQRLSKFGLLENPIARRLQAVIEDRRRMLGVKGPSSPKAAIEITPTAAARQASPVIPDSSPVIAPRQPEPLAPAQTSRKPLPVSPPVPAPLQSAPASIPPSPPEAPKDKLKPAPISLGLSDDKVKSKPPVEHAAAKPGASPVLHEPVRQVVKPSPPPKPPRKPLSEILAAFMEKSNIRWGEVVGGLLIVGCSVALIISLWDRLERIPYFQFLIFVSVTAALFGIGLYTLKRWKLESTSRGVLAIATLLVPLNFLAIAGLSKGTGGFLDALIELASVGIFAILVGIAGRVLVPDARWLFTLGFVGASASQLLIVRLIHPECTEWRYFALGLLPTALYCLSAGGILSQSAVRRPFGRKDAGALFSHIGMSTFAAGVALGFLVYRYGNLTRGLQSEAVLIALCGIPIAMVGILAQQRLTRDPANGPFRAFGTGLALLGMLLMLYAVVLAWPKPHLVVLVCSVNFLVLTALAIALRLAIAHMPALASLIAGYLTGYHWIFGYLPQPAGNLGPSLAERIVSAESATALTGLFVILMLAAYFIYGAKRQTERAIYLAASEIMALGSLILVLMQGFAAPAHPAFVFGIYGLAALLLNLRWRQAAAAYGGLALLCISSVWMLDWLYPQRLHLWASVLASEALLLAVVLVSLHRFRLNHACANAKAGSADRDIYRDPIARLAELIAPIAFLIGCMAWAASASPRWVLEHLVTGACLFAFYLLLAAIERRQAHALLSGIMWIATVIAGVGWMGKQFGTADLRAWMAFAVAVAGMTLALFAIRLPQPHSEYGNPDSKGSAPAQPDKPDLYETLAGAWRHAAAMATVLSWCLIVSSPTLGKFGLHTVTIAALGLTSFLLSWSYGSRHPAWIGSVLIFMCIVHAIFVGFPKVTTSRIVLAASLLHSTIALIAGFIMEKFRRAGDAGERLRRVLVQPVAASSLISSFLSLAVFIPVFERSRMLEISLYAFWLSLLWLATSCFKRWPVLFALSQAASCVALLFAITSWLDRQPWVAGYRDGLTDPRSLQSYGIGLALACLVWAAARIRLRSNPGAQALLSPSFYPFDRIILSAVVCGHVLLSLSGTVPSVLEELSMARPAATVQQAIVAWRMHVGSPGGWALLGILAVSLTIALRETWRRSRVLAILVLSLTAPILIASRFNTDLSVGAALRWGLAAWFLVWSAALWFRSPAILLLDAMDFRVDRSVLPAAVIRNLITWVSASGVTFITIAAAVPGFGFMAAPAAGSFFWHIGSQLGYVVPLGILGLLMLGHALRDESQGFAFLTGQTLNFAITLAYALFVIEKGGVLNWIFMVQLATAAAGAWAIAWRLSGKWKGLQRLAPRSPAECFFINGQLWLGVCGNVILLGSALPWAAALYPRSVARIGDFGSLIGWLAMVAVAAALWIRPERKSTHWNEAGSVALALVGLIACTVERALPGSVYHVLMLGWATLAIAAAAAADWLLRLRAHRSDESFASETEDSATRWVRIAGVLSVLLGAKAAWYGDHLWAAAALAGASLAGAWMAVLLQNKGWAFISGLGANAAVSLVVWHYHASLLLLFQTNLIASATIALLWLAVRRRLSPKQRQDTSIDYLFVQVGISLLGNACLILAALISVVWDPDHLPLSLVGIGSVWGWLALTLSVVAGVWYWRQKAPQFRFHLLCAFGLALGALLAASVCPWSGGNWLSYHTLEASWIVAGCLVLLAGRTLRNEILPKQTLRLWIQTIIFLAVALAVRGAWQDPGKPWWSAGVGLAASVLLGALAIRFRTPGCVYASGLMANVIGILIWIGIGTGTVTGGILTNAICFALASLIWLAIEIGLRHRPGPIDLRGSSLPFAHAAALCSLALLGSQVSAFLISGFSNPGVSLADSLAWTALAATFAALALSLWDPQVRFTCQAMYAAGLMGTVMALHAARLSPRELCWTVSLALSSYIALMAILSLPAPLYRRLDQLLRVPQRQRGWPVEWFFLIQRLLACLPLGLSLWITLTFERTGSRFAGPLSVVLILAAVVFLAKRIPGDRRLRWQGSVLFLAVLAMVEAGWAWLGLSYPSLLLHRTAIVLIALGIASTVAFFAPAQDSTSGSGWSHAIRRQRRAMIFLTLVSLALMLFDEALLYVPAAGTPIALPAVFGVAMVVAALIAAGICCALVPAIDPFTIPERKRSLHIYFAEVMLALLFVHVWLTAPEFFLVQGFLKYWTLIIMALAFLGTGLAQVFDRKGMTILAAPLLRTGVFLPILPVLGFWVRPTGNYSLLWFLVGLLYGFLSTAKRSYRFGLLAAISANNALWLVLHQTGVGFLQHPQMWLAPIAVTALITEYLNHDRLTRTQSETVRYLALTVIYIASTADMFIAGLGNSLILPLVLLLLAVLGVLSGILLRIRAYLFLGVLFLFLVIVSMIWHAAVNLAQTWIWYASGIVLGAAILSLFALFEKRREDMLSVVEGLKRWD
jgi:hypothetical protein